MHHSRLASSARLRRTLRALQRAKGEISTGELARRARIHAVSAAISELRANGAKIDCRREYTGKKRRWLYTLVKSPEGH